MLTLFFVAYNRQFYFQPQPELAAVSPSTPAVAVPTQSVTEPLDSDALPKYKRDLAAKARVLRAELQALQPQTGHCRIEVYDLLETLTKFKKYFRT